MKTRSTLTPAEAMELHAEIERRLANLGVETQPAVAARIVALVSDPQAGLRQYADIVKTDAALSGRLLRLANSALFAQVKAVTSLERACVLLGLERLKAVSLGFYLSRAVATDPASHLSRRVWGQAVLRACLAAELARAACPTRVPEAFTIGLMLDAGLPLLHRMLGRPVERIVRSAEPPARQFIVELETLPFTHVDVIAALVRRWSLPELLARPIESHHVPPLDTARTEPVHQLHRVAFYAGAVSLTHGVPTSVANAFPGIAQGVLNLTAESLANVVARATAEYTAIRDVFRDVADDVDNLAAMAERVHEQLLAVLDRSLAESLRQEVAEGPVRFTVGPHRIEIEADRAGRAVAYLSDERGERLVSYSFEAGRLGAAPLLDALGLEPAPPEQTADLEHHLRSLAA